MGRFDAAIAKAKQHDPMSNGHVPTVPGRVLLADGDGLCYYCAGNDDTPPGMARANLLDKLQSAASACGAEHILVLLTGRGSHKGHRYAIARAKPYQGQRDGGNRPKNWEFLRTVLEAGSPGREVQVEVTQELEADDLFAQYADWHDDVVIYTQDKDMQTLPGLHLDWLTHITVRVPDGTWSLERNDKLWGRAWFWSQMLHGDAADNIPGLPFYTDGSLLKSGPKKGQLKQIRVGEKSPAVLEMLPKVASDMGACVLLQDLYLSCYKERWCVEMLEQACLLWLRRSSDGDLWDVLLPGGPLHPLAGHADMPAAKAELLARIAAVPKENNEEVEDGRDSGGAEGHLGCSDGAVCDLQTALLRDPGGAGSLPHNREDTGGTAPGVQCGAGQSGEQLQ